MECRWASIAADLEMIQTEGKQAIKQVDPFMVLKKTAKLKRSRGTRRLVGHILPFELVQTVKLPQELANLKAKRKPLRGNCRRTTEYFKMI